MKFFGFAAIFALSAVVLAAPAEPTPTSDAAVPTSTDVLVDIEWPAIPADFDFDFDFDPETRAAKKSSCKRCDVYCGAGAMGPDPRLVRTMCATCIAVELITNKGKRC